MMETFVSYTLFISFSRNDAALALPSALKLSPGNAAFLLRLFAHTGNFVSPKGSNND